MEKKKKYVSIRSKVQRIVLSVAVIALVLDSAVAVFVLNQMQNEAVDMERSLGEYASEEGAQAILRQMEQNMADLANSKVHIAEESLGKYSSYVQMFADYIETLYADSDSYARKEVLPPSQKNYGKLTMQRAFRDKSLNYEMLGDEVGLLGNVEAVFEPIFKNSDGLIATIYLGTESGIMVAYDENSYDPELTEDYFDYSQSSWYNLAREAGTVVFTDTYMDSFGRGLTISCAAPFYDRNGKFAGAVSMDILAASMSDSIIDVNVGEHSYAFLLDKDGNIIASPYMDFFSEEFENINQDTNSMAYGAADLLLSGDTGVTLTDGGIYYAYAPINLANWTLAIHIDSADITGPIDEIGRTIAESTDEVEEEMLALLVGAEVVFIAIIIIMVIVVVIVSRIFAKKLTEPIISLREDVAVIEEGNLDHYAEISSADEIEDLAKGFNHMVVSLKEYIENLTTMTAEKERIGAELDVATRIQADMLPSIFPAFPDREEFDLYASMNPAKEVGGDFYDFFMVDDSHLALVIADVSGKGVPAALFMMISKTLIKNAAQQGMSPKNVLENVNRQLCETNKEDMFVTVWLGILDVTTGVMVCTNAGHEYPAIRRKGGEFELYQDKHGFVVGGMEMVRYKEYEITLNPGDMIFVYTDGVPEATNAENELFGTDRMIEALKKSEDQNCESVLQVVRADVDTFVGEAPQFDDLTMLAMVYHGANQEERTGVTKMKELTVEATIENVERVTDFINEELEAIGCPMKAQMQVDIAIDELFSNIANYAYNPITGPATVCVEILEKPLAVCITFIDEGTPYDPLAKEDPDVTLSAEERQIGGLGIFMVKKSMDDVKYEYKDGKNILKITKIVEEA